MAKAFDHTQVSHVSRKGRRRSRSVTLPNTNDEDLPEQSIQLKQFLAQLQTEKQKNKKKNNEQFQEQSENQSDGRFHATVSRVARTETTASGNKKPSSARAIVGAPKREVTSVSSVATYSDEDNEDENDEDEDEDENDDDDENGNGNGNERHHRFQPTVVQVVQSESKTTLSRKISVKTGKSSNTNVALTAASSNAYAAITAKSSNGNGGATGKSFNGNGGTLSKNFNDNGGTTERNPNGNGGATGKSPNGNGGATGKSPNGNGGTTGKSSNGNGATSGKSSNVNVTKPGKSSKLDSFTTLSGAHGDSSQISSYPLLASSINVTPKSEMFDQDFHLDDSSDHLRRNDTKNQGRIVISGPEKYYTAADRKLASVSSTSFMAAIIAIIIGIIAFAFGLTSLILVLLLRSTVNAQLAANSTNSTTTTDYATWAAVCSSYTPIADPTRSVNAPGYALGCDNTAPFLNGSTPVWIRFIGTGGTTLPLATPGMNICGTQGTGWYSGTMPSSGQMINGTVCFTWTGSICRFSQSITVANCGSFYTYLLPPVPACMIRYCTI